MDVKPFLRDVAADTRAWETRLAQARADGNLVRCGEACRFLGRHDEAVAYHAEAFRRDPANRAARLGHATALYYRGDHAEAETRFRTLLDEGGELSDYVWQHFGKCLAEMGRLDEATGCFEQALALREARGSADLVASTRRALAEAAARR